MMMMRRSVGFLLIGVAGCFDPSGGEASGSATETGSSGTEGSSATMTAGSNSASATTPTSADDTTSDPTGNPTGDPTTDTVDTSVGTEATDTTDTTDTTGAPACGGGAGACVAPTPAGWTGPVAIAEAVSGDPAPVCGAEFPDASTALLGDFDIAASNCDCECTANGVSCDTTAQLLIWDNAGDCAGAPVLSLDISVFAACASIITLAGGSYPASLTPEPLEGAQSPLELDYFGLSPVGISGGMCSAQATEEIGATGFGLQATLCGFTEPVEGECDGADVCVPAPGDPFAARLCVWQEGDEDCPAGYPDKTLYHQDFVDTRDCSTCDCGDPQGDCPGALAELQELDDGNCEDLFTAGTGDCAASNMDDVELVSFVPGAPQATCDGPGTSVLQGDATPTGPVTVCCTPV